MTQAPARSRVDRNVSAAVLARVVSPGRLALVVAVGLATLALALRLWNIDRESLWLDEGYTLLFSQLSLDRLILVGGVHEHPPLYYLIVHAVLSVWDSALAPRIISAIAGSLSVLVLYLLGVRLFNRSTGLIAAALLTVAPFHLWYSEDGRAYELAGLLVLLSYLLVFAALEHPRALLWSLYVGCTAGALFTEYTTALVLLPQALILLRARQVRLGRTLVTCWVAVTLLFAPWLVTLWLDAQSVATNYWVPPPTIDSVVNTTLIFLNIRTPCPTPPCTGHQVSFPLLAGQEYVVAGVAITALGVVLITALWRRDLKLLLVTLWLIVPFATILLIATRRSLYLDRVFLDATFALYLLLGLGASRARKHLGSSVLVVAVVLTALLAALANYQPLYAELSNPDWKSTVRDFHAAYRPGQAVVFNPGALRPLVFAYLPKGWRPTREAPLWFHSYLDVPGWEKSYGRLARATMSDSRVSLKDRYARYDAGLRNSELSQAARGMRQVWLITQDYSGLTDTRRWFVTHGFHLLLSQLYFGDARLELWDRRLPPRFGPAVVPDDGFTGPWSASPNVRVIAGTVRQTGTSTMTRSFSVVPGAAYTVNVEYRAIPHAHPSISVQLYDRTGRPAAGMVDRFGQRLLGFPRTEWYDLPVNGVWLAQPFGFITPPGAARAVLRLNDERGTCYWRHIAVYREQGWHSIGTSSQRKETLD